MINDRNRLFIRVFVFFLIAMVLCGLQTSLWFQVFGNLAMPAFWLIFIIYISIYRNLIEGLLVTYLYSVAMSNYTVMPEGIFTLCNLVVFLIAYAIRTRVAGSSVMYFAAFSGLSVLLFSISELGFSWFFEANPLKRPDVLHVIFQIIMTAIAAFPIHGIMYAIDTLLEEDSTETWRGTS